jgi:hypothetical protein
MGANVPLIQPLDHNAAMGQFLQIVGGLVLAILFLAVVLVGAGVLWFRFKVRQMKKLARAMGGPVAPIGIHLETVSEPSWRDHAQADRWSAEFAAAGYRRIGAFTVREIPDFGMVAYVNGEGTAYGGVSEHPMTGVYAEVVRLCADGRVLTSTHVKTQVEAAAPHKETVRLPGAPVVDLIAALEAIPGQGFARPHSADAFQEDFEASYRRDMEWSYTHGPLQDTDAGLISRMIGQEADAETLAFLRGLRSDGDGDEPTVDEEIRRRWLETNQITAAEWERSRDSHFFIHEGTSDDELTEIAAQALPEFEEMPETADPLPGADAFARFDGLIRAWNVEDRFHRLGRFEEPVAYVIYRLKDLP